MDKGLRGETGRKIRSGTLFKEQVTLKHKDMFTGARVVTMFPMVVTTGTLIGGDRDLVFIRKGINAKKTIIDRSEKVTLRGHLTKDKGIKHIFSRTP